MHSADKMKMEMVDFLAPVMVTINNQTVAVVGNAFLAGYLRGYQDHPAGEPFILVGQVV